jgi:hypothetical protein
LETVKKIFRVDRREIAFIRFVFEACDGIATMRTLDGPSGTVMLSISPGCEHEVDAVLHDLKSGIMIESVVPEEEWIRRSHDD